MPVAQRQAFRAAGRHTAAEAGGREGDVSERGYYARWFQAFLGWWRWAMFSIGVLAVVLGFQTLLMRWLGNVAGTAVTIAAILLIASVGSTRPRNSIR